MDTSLPSRHRFRWGQTVVTHSDLAADCLGWLGVRATAISTTGLGETMRTRYGVEVQEHLHPARGRVEAAFCWPVGQHQRMTWAADEPPAPEWVGAAGPSQWYGGAQAAQVAGGLTLRRLFVVPDEVGVWQMAASGLAAVCPVFSRADDRRITDAMVAADVLYELVPRGFRVVVLAGERGRPLARRLAASGIDAGVMDATATSAGELLLRMDDVAFLARYPAEAPVLEKRAACAALLKAGLTTEELGMLLAEEAAPC